MKIEINTSTIDTMMTTADLDEGEEDGLVDEG